MASEEPGSVEAVDPQPRRRVPPPTIDLEATPGAPKPRAGRRWSLVAAGVLGAVLALGVVAGAWALLGPSFVQRLDQRVDRRDDQGSDTDARLTRIETQLTALAHASPSPGDARIPDEVTQRLARIESALAQQSAAVDRQIKPLADRLADIDHRDQEAAAVAQIARERADAAAKSLADVAQQLAQLNAERARTPQVERADLDALAARLARLESATKAIGDQLARQNEQISRQNQNSGVATGDARQALLAIALKEAIERGVPYAPELDAMRPFADAGTLAALEPFAKSGVPSAAALAHDATALVPALVTAADTSRPDGVWPRLWINAKRMIRLRPVGNVPGGDVDAVIARLELKAAHDDVDGVLAEAASLPASARGPLEPWIARAQARNAALAAASRVATATLEHLGRDAAQDAPQR